MQKKIYDGLEIAVIGISGQFPKSEDYRSYWKNLCEEGDLFTHFTDQEVLDSGVSKNNLNNERYVKVSGVLEGKEYFDHGFFEYRPEEVSLMDPQIRIFHEHCWKALEDAGCISQNEKKKIGLFAGASENGNWKLYTYTKSGDTSIDPFYLQMISNQNYLSTLTSYKLNLKGPSLSISTACSTSLVAVDP